ncbi:MAG: polysaccharide deacetylase family protein, partial [Clostridia bacterium]|nr:polysaccharide deacetylase family protein [Clostridia bacterium]
MCDKVFLLFYFICTEIRSFLHNLCELFLPFRSESTFPHLSYISNKGYIRGIFMQSNKQRKWGELPIYCVETDKKVVGLSFDAAWGNDDTEQILAILKKHNVHVTFFMTGGWVEAYPEDVKAIYAAGHDVGNHGENHKNMSQISNEEKKE